MKKFLASLFSVIISVSLLYSESVNDSILNQVSEPDTFKRIQILIKHSQEELNQLASNSEVYALEAVKLSGIVKDDTLQAKSYFQLGLSQYRLNKYDDAILNFNECLRIAKSKANLKLTALTLNRLGNTYQLKGEYIRSLEKYNEASRINSALNDKLEIARTLTNIGSIYRLYGSYEKAIGLQLDALKIYDEIENKDGYGWTALNIARLFKSMGNYPKAIEYVDLSLDNYTEVEQNTGVGTGVTLGLKEKASIYTLTGDLDKAIEFNSKVLEKNQQSGNQHGVANTYNALGRIYFEKNDLAKASDYLNKSLNLKNELNDNLDIASILRIQGDILSKQSKYILALDKINESLKIAQKLRLIEEIKDGYHSLSKLYSLKGQEIQSLRYFKKYSELKDSLNNQQINELELQYEFDKQQQEAEYEQLKKDAEQKARLQRQKIYTIVAIVGILLMAVIAIYIYRGYKRKKQMNDQLRKQKKEIEEQRDEIEAQRDLATSQRDQISRQKEVITDSIEYARRIQNAILPQAEFLADILPEHFIFYIPKNIVSGDYYWISRINGKDIIAVADCTGHGVPGAFMSMLGISLLNEIVNKNQVLEPHQILTKMKEGVINSLHQEHGYMGSKDGMDMALCVIDREENKLQFSGAYNPLYLIRNGELQEYKAEKMPVGIHAARKRIQFNTHNPLYLIKNWNLQEYQANEIPMEFYFTKREKEFVSLEIEIQKGDALYMFTDGYLDQFGGKEGLKFRQKPFKDMLLEISEEPVEKQKELIEKRLIDWKGDHAQLDDILVMGIRI